MLLLLLLLITPSLSADGIQSVTTNTSLVSTPATVTVVLNLTSSTQIQFMLPLDYTVSTTNCLNQNSAASCSLSTGTNTQTLTFIGVFSGVQSFAFNVVNPYYESNFELYTYSHSTLIGGGSTILVTKAYPGICVLTPSSTVVGAQSTGTFTIIMQPVPANSSIYLTFTRQTVFQDVISNFGTISCQSSITTAQCSLSNSDTTSYTIRVGNMFMSNYGGGVVTFNLSTMNNPPYNDTFGSIYIEVADQNSNKIEYCNVSQPAPSTLPTSIFSYSGWNSTVNSRSTMNITLLPRTTLPNPFSLLLILPIQLTISPNPPTTSTSSSNSTHTLLTISNLAFTSNRVNFTCVATNPASVRTMALTAFFQYTPTQFIERGDVSNLTMTVAALTVGATMSTTVVMLQGILAVTGGFVDPVLAGFVEVSVDQGVIVCNATIKISGTTVTALTCNSSVVILPAANLTGTNVISIGFLNPMSTVTAIVTVKTRSSNNQSISEGSTQMGFTAARLNFTVTNSNPILGQNSTITLVEASNNFITNQRRIFTISIPSNLNISSLNVTGQGLNSFSVSSSTLTVDYNGLLNTTLSNLTNPVLYDGSRNWSISCTDPLGNPVSSGDAVQSVEYSPATATFTISLDNSVIESNTTAGLVMAESLRHYTTNYITIGFQKMTVLAATGSQSYTVTPDGQVYVPYAVNMRLVVGLALAATPGNYSCTVRYFTSSGILLEVGTSNVTVTQMQYTLTASFTGFMGQQGQLNINILNKPSTPVTLSYSTSSVFTSGSCKVCNSTVQYLTGIVVFFQNTTIQIQGIANGIVYASGNVTVSYPCLPGCHICNETSCSQCFTSAYTTLVYFYNGGCLSSCPYSTYTAGTNCINCSANCYQCNSSQCLNCSSGFYLYKGACTNNCPDGFIPVGGGCEVKPIICQTGCKECVTDTTCIVCEDNYSLYNSVCYSTCPDGLISESGLCVPAPIPPVESKHFPFPFLLAALALLIILSFFRLFDKRSLILGNFISMSSFLELGCILMFLGYNFLDKDDVLNQSLTYITILTKLGFNIFFLIYFLKKISKDELFEKWVQKQKSHANMKTATIVIGCITSFQFYRFLYSRLLGLQLFFARFSSPLILKPMTYLTIAYGIITSGCLITLSILSLIRQSAIHTSLFYASIQILILEVLLLVMEVIDNKRKSDEHFDYQIYKVDNEFSASNIPAVEGEAEDLGGSFGVGRNDGHMDGAGQSSETEIKDHWAEVKEEWAKSAQSAISSAQKTGQKGKQNIFDPGEERAEIMSNGNNDSNGQIVILGDQSGTRLKTKTKSRTHTKEKTEEEIEQQKAQEARKKQQEDQIRQKQLEIEQKYSAKGFSRRKVLDQWNEFQSATHAIRNKNKNKSVSPSRSSLQVLSQRSISNDKVGDGKASQVFARSQPPLNLEQEKTGEQDGKPLGKGKSTVKTPERYQSAKNILSGDVVAVSGVIQNRSAINFKKNGKANESQKFIGTEEGKEISEIRKIPGSEHKNQKRQADKNNGDQTHNKDSNIHQHGNKINEQGQGIGTNAGNISQENIEEKNTEQQLVDQIGKGSNQQISKEAVSNDEKSSEGDERADNLVGIELKLDQDLEFDGPAQYATPRMGINQELAGNDQCLETGVRQPGKELDDDLEDLTAIRKRKKFKKKVKGSRYRNTAVEEIYLQRLSASVTKPVKKPHIDRDF